MRTRAERRHQKARYKARAKRLVRLFSAASIRGYDEEEVNRLTLVYEKQRKPCSCAMCGNPRRHFGEVTRQEAATSVEGSE